MGIFAGFRRNTESLEEHLTQIEKSLEERHIQNIQNEALAMIAFIACIAGLRLVNGKRTSLLRGEHILNIKSLNDVNMYKEVFLAYLNAALLEPVLAIAGMEEVVGEKLIISILTLVSICWWIWLVTDAFDCTDVMQHFKFHGDIAQEIQDSPEPLKWLRLVNKDNDGEKRSLVGSLQRDVALWFMLSCIGAALIPGGVNHRDVMHAYVVVFLWIILHHSCRQATTWSGGYFITFIFPSAALMPLEYCLPIMDVSDCVENLEFLIKYREYVKRRTGVELIIES